MERNKCILEELTLTEIEVLIEKHQKQVYELYAKIKPLEAEIRKHGAYISALLKFQEALKLHEGKE